MFDNGRVAILAEALAFPEGPIYTAEGDVLVVEVKGATLTRVRPNGAHEIVSQHVGGPNGAALGPDGRVYVCNNGGLSWVSSQSFGTRPAFPSQPPGYTGGSIERVDIRTGRVERLYERSDQAPLRGPNDLVFDDHGGFWFTDTGKGQERTSERGSVCYARADGSLCTEAIFPLVQPNGIGLSPDGSRLYVAETLTARLWAFDVVGPGALALKPYPSPNGGELVYTAPGYRLLDSLAVEACGNVCVGTIFDGGISVISPEGELVEHIALEDTHVTNLCFGGPQLEVAYVTLSSSGRLASVKWPRAGLRLAY